MLIKRINFPQQQRPYYNRVPSSGGKGASGAETLVPKGHLRWPTSLAVASEYGRADAESVFLIVLDYPIGGFTLVVLK